MSQVGILSYRQNWSERPYRFASKEHVRTGVRLRRYLRVPGRSMTVQEIRPPDTDGALGVGNAIPFSHVPNPMIAPARLHYEIPHAGDLGLQRHFRSLIQVSGRTAPEIRALECVPLPKLSSG